MTLIQKQYNATAATYFAYFEMYSERKHHSIQMYRNESSQSSRKHLKTTKPFSALLPLNYFPKRFSIWWIAVHNWWD